MATSSSGFFGRSNGFGAGGGLESSFRSPTVRPEIDVATVAAQEIHEALVIGVGHVEQPDYLAVVPSRPRQTATDHSLDLTFRDQPIGVGPGDRLPEVVHLDLLDGFPNERVAGKSDVVGMDDIALDEVVRALDQVMEFPDVSGKTVRLELAECIDGKRTRSTVLGVQPVQKTPGQERDIPGSLPQRRHLDAEDVQPVKQILPELSGTSQRSQIAVGRGDDANLEVAVDGIAQTPDLFFLENSKELHLKSPRRVGDLVEEKGSVVRFLKQARFVRNRRCESASAVPKQFAFDQVLGKGAAVDRHEALWATGA